MPRFQKRKITVPVAGKKGQKSTKDSSQVYTGTRFNEKVNRFKSVNPYGIKAEPFPRVMYTRAKFSHNKTLGLGALADFATADEYRMSTIWDPLKAAGGKTVCGHAQLAAIYDQYLVLGAKVRVAFSTSAAGAMATGTMCGVRLRINGNDTVQSETVQTLTNKPLTYVGGLNNNGEGKKNFSLFVRPWTLMGISKLEYMANSSAYSSSISANPANVDLCLMDVFVNNAQSNAVTLEYTIQIIYYVKLFSRKPLDST